MQDRRTFARVPVLIATLVVALLLLIGTYSVVAGQVEKLGRDADSPVASSSASSWSRWATIPTGTCPVFNHNLGGDPNDYAVEMLFLDTDDGLGLNRRYYGGLEDSGDWYGAHWQELTANTIKVCRFSEDQAADRIRIRVWLPPADPDYASPWTDINPNQTITFEHGLNITATELTVSLWFSSTNEGIHNAGYGGLAVDDGMTMEGAHWHDLTDTSIQVTRHSQDSLVEEVRVVVVHGDLPAYDSLEDLGDWQSIAAGDVYTFTHGLSWDPNLLLMRSECYSFPGGIHHWLAGGNHDWLNGGQWQGANLQNLTANTVQVYRQPDDDVCPQVRVRIWKSSGPIYLPLVLNNYSP
jgi:hypothetical protein